MTESTTDTVLDVAIVGAGFAGLYALYRLRSLGLVVRVYEAGGGVGGTWYWNRYPGCRCDVESLQYSYSFSRELEQEWEWTERYASQPEILSYLEHVAERFELLEDIQFETRIRRAEFDETARHWRLESDDGERITARHCVVATGCLSVPNLPRFADLDSFRGATYQTGRWPHERVDFKGQSVAVIGTGSSAIQAIPLIAAEARELFVLQRTPNFSAPARNRPLSPETAADWKTNAVTYRNLARQNHFAFYIELGAESALEVSAEERSRAYEEGWQHGGFRLLTAYADLLSSHEANATAAEFVRDKIRGIVDDPRVARTLLPFDYPIGAKRLCIDTDYYATFNRDNVTLVDLRETPIERFSPTGIVTSTAEYRVDSIIFATGFDAMTGALCRMEILGRDGQLLADAWSAGPHSYLGLMVAGFPNLYIVTGPGSPSVLSNMVVSIEQQIDWIANCIADLRRDRITTIEATPEAQRAWVAHVAEVGNMTVYPAAASWYTGANIEGKPRIFMPYMGGFPAYRAKCDAVAAAGYAGFALVP